MDHVKGKLKLIEKNQTLSLVAILPDGSEFLVIPDWDISSDESVGIFCDAELERANFQHIAKCWNCQDDFIKICEMHQDLIVLDECGYDNETVNKILDKYGVTSNLHLKLVLDEKIKAVLTKVRSKK